MGWASWRKVEGFQFDHIIYERKRHTELEGEVARIAFNRPEKLNAFSAHTMREVNKAFDDAAEDVNVGAIIITGTGGNFSSGGDVEWEATGAEFSEILGVSEKPQSEESDDLIINEVVRKCPKPVIARVEGYCIGGANHLAYTCDFTITADTGIFGHNGARVGSPNHSWPVALAALVIGIKRAKEMHILLPRYTAQEALQMGLVNKVVPASKLEEEVDKWCEQIFLVSPSCIQLRKASFNALIDMITAYTGPYGDLLRKMHPNFVNSEERKECFQAFFEKRKPMCFKKYVEEHSKPSPDMGT